nr:hypothetical protein [Didymella theifolia botybirnavirus 1]
MCSRSARAVRCAAQTEAALACSPISYNLFMAKMVQTEASTNFPDYYPPDHKITRVPTTIIFYENTVTGTDDHKN